MNFKEQLTKEVDQAVSKFRKQTKKIEESTHPKYAVPGTREFEVDQLKAELEAQVSDINARYKEQAAAHLEASKQSAAMSVFKPSVTDKDFVKSVLDDFTSSVAFAYSDTDKEQAFKSLESRFDYMSPEQLYAVKAQLPTVLQSVKDDEYSLDKLKGVNSTLSKLKTAEQKDLEEAKELAKASPDHKFRTLKMTNRYYNKQTPIGGIEG